MSSGTSRKRFEAAYREGLKNRDRRMAGLEGKLYRAAKKGKGYDPEPLIDHFRSDGPLTLSAEECSTLAWFLERMLPQKRGKRQGPMNFAVEVAACLLWFGKRAWCRHYGHQIATKDTPVDRLVERAIELVQPHIEGLPGPISVEAIRDFKVRPRQEIFAYIADFLPDAFAEITKAAVDRPALRRPPLRRRRTPRPNPTRSCPTRKCSRSSATSPR